MLTNSLRQTTRPHSVYTFECLCGHRLESESTQTEGPWCHRQITLVWCVAVEKVAEFLVKGKHVYVEGRLQTRSYDDKDGKKVYATEVVADDVILLSGQGEGHSVANGQARAAAPSAATKGKPSAAVVAQEDYAISDEWRGLVCYGVNTLTG